MSTTTTDLADRILKKADHWRWRMPEYARFSDHAEKVLARHGAAHDCRSVWYRKSGLDLPTATNRYQQCAWWPCPDVHDLAECWGVGLDD